MSALQLLQPQHNTNYTTIRIITTMHLQQTNKIQAEQTLPYQPIKFVFTQTIGSLADKFKEILDPYTWTYEDILEPKPVMNLGKVEYYLFHIAPIYNWLRGVGSEVVGKYLQKGQHEENSKMMGKLSTPRSKDVYKNFQPKIFHSQLSHYISQWEIVKLCACAKIKVLTTRTGQPGHHSNNSNNNNNKNKLYHKHQQLLCTHMIKKERFTTEYTLNDFESSVRLECTKCYCDECQISVPIQAEIVKYPFAPFFTKFYGKEFVLNNNKTNKLEYQLVIVYCLDRTFVKSAGGVWYDVTKDKVQILSFERVDIKNGKVFVYQQKVVGRNVLRKAERTSVNERGNLLKKGRNPMLDEVEQDDDLEYGDMVSIKAKPLPLPLSFSLPLPPQQQPTQPIQQQQNQALEQISKLSFPIIMSKKHTDRALFKQYKSIVGELLPKPKKKDQYERDYDKGKIKKIHKNRQVFRTADFFGLYNKIKGQRVEGDKVERDNIEGEQREEKNQINEEKDDDKKDSKDVRADGFTDRRGGFGDRRGGKFGDRRGGKFGDRNSRGGGRAHDSRGNDKFSKHGKGRDFGGGKSRGGKFGGKPNNRQNDKFKPKGGKFKRTQ